MIFDFLRENKDKLSINNADEIWQPGQQRNSEYLRKGHKIIIFSLQICISEFEAKKAYCATHTDNIV